MAQYWEDWSGSTLGNAPTGWTARWDSGATPPAASDGQLHYRVNNVVCAKRYIGPKE